MNKAAFLISQSVVAVVTALGMQAENKQREIQQDSPAYVMDDFERVILDCGIGYNDSLKTLNGDKNG